MISSNGNIKVLVVGDNPSNAYSFYRGILPMADLTRQNVARVDVELLGQGTPLSWPNLIQYDCFLLTRPFRDDTVGLFQAAKAMGRKVWVDYDDNLFAVPASNYTWSTYLNPEQKKRIGFFMEHADAVTVSTPDLKECLSWLRQDIDVIPNAWPLTMPENHDGHEPNKVIAWRGGPSHFADMEPYVDDIVTILEKHTDYSLYTFGHPHWGLDGRVPKERWRHFGPIADTFKYFQTFFQVKPSVVLVPLADSTFNRCKSNIAWQEATIAGASAVVPEWPEWNVPAGKYRKNRGFIEAFDYALENRAALVKQSLLDVPDYLTQLKARAAVLGKLFS